MREREREEEGEKEKSQCGKQGTEIDKRRRVYIG